MGYAILKYLNIAEKLGVAESMAKATSGCGLILNILGLHGLANGYHARAERWAKHSGSMVAIAGVANIHGLHHAHMGRWDDAVLCFDQANTTTVLSGDLNTWYTSSLHKVQVLLERGNFADVFDIGVSLVHNGRDTGHGATSYLGLTVLGCAMWRLRSWRHALLPLGISLKSANAAGDRLSETFIEGELAICLIGKGDLDAALIRVENALERIHSFKIRTNPVGTVLVAKAELSVARLRVDKSAHLVVQARRDCERALSVTRRFHFGFSRALRLMGTFCWINGRADKADRYWNESLRVAGKINATFEAALTEMEMGRCKGLAQPLDSGQRTVDAMRRKAESSPGMEAAVKEIAAFRHTLNHHRI